MIKIIVLDIILSRYKFKLIYRGSHEVQESSEIFGGYISIGIMNHAYVPFFAEGHLFVYILTRFEKIEIKMLEFFFVYNYNANDLIYYQNKKFH